MTPRLVLAVALAAAAITTAAPARADDQADDDRALIRAKKFHKEGEKLFALGKFAAALDKYEAAFEAKPIPAFLFNIGQCHRNLGDYDAAIFSFRKYLKLQPDAVNRDAVNDYIDELEREKEKRSAGDLSLIPPDNDPDDGHVVGPVDNPKPGKPIYKRWWFWGGIAVVGAGTGAFLLTRGGGTPGTDLGNIDFGK